MIQLINYSGQDGNMRSNEILVSSLNNPMSLDVFDVNIIDLRDKELWRNKNSSYNTIDAIKDFRSLNIMISNSIKSKIVYVLPQNLDFKYNEDRSENGYFYSISLKDMLPTLSQDILKELFPRFKFINIVYENTNTIISSKNIHASFYFDSYNEMALTKSIGSNKSTTIELESRIFTFLNLSTYSDIVNFLKEVNIIEEKIDVPDWILEFNFFNDNEKKQIINECNEKIKSLQDEINYANNVLLKNHEYKSILYSNGNELVKVVFEILEFLLSIDLKDFKDEKREDFLIKMEHITFLGEIKGVTSNVRSEHISQLDVHLQGYKDKLAEEDKEENVKSVLIINHQRNGELLQRQPVHENQIKLAERNGSLIIEIHTLLKLFEQFKLGKLTSDEFLHRIEVDTGLLAIK